MHYKRGRFVLFMLSPHYLTFGVSPKTPCPSFKVGHQLLILTRLETHSALMQTHFRVTCDIVLKSSLRARYL